MKNLPVFVLAPLVAILAACSGTPKPDAASVLTDKEVLAIAREAVANNETWLDQAEFDAPKRGEGAANWTVMVWRLPKTPGGFRVVAVDDAGQVVSYMRGR